MLLNLSMSNNKKIYTLVICFDEEEDVVEWVQESIAREEELPDDFYEVKDIFKPLNMIFNYRPFFTKKFCGSFIPFAKK